MQNENKRYTIYTESDKKIKVRANRGRKILKLKKLANNHGYQMLISDELKFRFRDSNGNYVIGSPDKGVGLGRAWEEIKKILPEEVIENDRD